VCKPKDRIMTNMKRHCRVLYERCDVDISYALSSSTSKFGGGSSSTDANNAATNRIVIGLGVAVAAGVSTVAFIIFAKKRREIVNLMGNDDGRGSWKRDDMANKLSK
jgi:hypothetical protein